MPDDADIDALFVGLRAAKQERQAAPGGPQWERERLPALAEDRGLVLRARGAWEGALARFGQA